MLLNEDEVTCGSKVLKKFFLKTLFIVKPRLDFSGNSLFTTIGLSVLLLINLNVFRLSRTFNFSLVK